MSEEELREKYRILRKKLYSIRENQKKLNDDYDELETLMKETLLIDNKIPEEEIFHSLKKDNLQIITELTNVVIPKVNSKL